MSDKYSLDDVFGPEPGDSEKQSKKDKQKKKSPKEGKTVQKKQNKKTRAENEDDGFDWGEAVADQETVNYTMNIYPYYRNIIQALSYHSRKSQREVLEIIIREYFQGREERLLEVLGEWEKKKNKEEGDFLI